MISAVAIALMCTAQTAGEVDPQAVFYMADFHDPAFTSTMLPIPRGRLSAHRLMPPYEAVLTADVTYVNGALALDPVHGVLYGNRCCTAGASIQAHDARTLELSAQKALNLETSGSLSIELDPVRRVLFVYDGERVELTAVSIESASYGRVLATITPPLTAAIKKGASSDGMAIDGANHRMFLTGADGGSVLAIDISGLYPSGGTFGAVEVTAQTARIVNNTGGSLAIDEAGRRVFVIPVSGVVRSFSADPPYRTLNEINVPEMSLSDCGLFFDGRNETLYVGREILGAAGPKRPLAIDKEGTIRVIPPTPFDGEDLTIYGVSFAGATGVFAERENTAPIPSDPIAVRVDQVGCVCLNATARENKRDSETFAWLFASLFWVARIFRVGPSV